ncbi:Sodium:sulfate symporter transmembrane region family protein [Trichomonas vaginalis G3]|uniref:Sodium:sulfate symporter transmembrane region family protein n=1 Tax=Trichomonas vaginalis (strain ATCC PRA-98 / G3) TaxID=412133 RepID=A2DTI9_TRIV3|nr:low-affinity phosphate transporter PHO91 family [Trichomonas vaginalis G3]EAY16298.1 Sodium:sulfate symporter transmembrane region family protein [Trichomonas vaginalis G3]KAI5523447.1 low-affinity phosphate transporter PHO91 family [Trichomonas vaginalis G3]|eukprot:XP_001328521.1 Sodium:sulfate symporter transmembrane region family protein [Trichomonas vaginalis G3]
MQSFSAPEPVEESSYARMKRVVNMDNSEVRNSVYTVQRAQEKSKFSSFLPIIGLAIFAIFYMVPMFPTHPIAHTCFAILIFAAYCWGTEFIPSYATAYIVCLLCVWLRVGYSESKGDRIDATTLATQFAAKFMEPIILVFLGSLTMSAALTKLSITDRVSTFLLSHISPKPKIVLIAIMFLNYFIAAFLSNVASTTLVLTFSLPIIRSLDPSDEFIKALLLGVAWSGNVGGMCTTISSPQNIIAIKYINDSGATSISFLQWVAFAIPGSILFLLCLWLYLVILFKPTSNELRLSTEVEFSPWTWKHTFACFITLLTIVLWVLEDTLSFFLGHVGITSLIPVIAFFCTGILNSEDFGALRWSTLVLMGGGLALGEAMKISGLLDLFADMIAAHLHNLSVYVVLLVLLVIEAILTSVINHTSAAAILFPVIQVIGDKLNATTSLLTCCALMVSGSQLFHISSFPNALISGVQKHQRMDPTKLTSESFLGGKEFFMYGWPTEIIIIVIIIAVSKSLVMALKLK